MPKLVLEIELDYPDNIHGDDPESFLWFRDEILLGAGEEGQELVLVSNEIGDEIGTVKVRSIVLNPQVDPLLAQVADMDRLLIRCRRELQSVLADINAEQVPFDGDDFHELLRDLDTALTPTK